MKICFLSKDYSYNGGGERMLCNLANELAKANEVTVISFDFSEKEAIYKLDAKIRFVACEIKRKKVNFLTKFDYIKYIKYNINFFNSFDAVIGVGIICNLVLAYYAPEIKCKTIAWEHFCYDGTPLYQKILRRFLFKRLSSVVILTNTDLPKYQKLNQKTQVIYNFTNMCFRKNPNPDSKQFLFVGRLSAQKGFFDLLKIIKNFCKINSDWTFRIIGNGEYKEKLEKFIDKERIKSRISWALVSQDVQSEMEDSACLILTSNYEGLPMVLIEAAVCALPSISYDTPTGPADIIADGKNGFLVPLHNYTVFLEKMKNISSDLNLRKQLSENAKEQSKKFNKNTILSKWNELLK